MPEAAKYPDELLLMTLLLGALATLALDDLSLPAFICGLGEVASL